MPDLITMNTESSEPPEFEPSEISGKVVILTILGLAILATSYAWWHQRQRGQAALDFWGQDIAFATRHAKQVELIKLDPDGGALTEEQTISLSEARGLIHARQALIVDASYDWDADLTAVTPKWQYSLRFPADEDRPACSLWFDLDQGVTGDESGKRLAKLEIPILKGLKTFFTEKVERAPTTD